MSGGLDAIGGALSAAFEALSSPGAFGVLAVALAFVFFISAVPKLRRPEIAAISIVDFGIGKRASRSAGLLLGCYELALAGLLLVSPLLTNTAREVLTVISALTLLCFTALIARALRSGEDFSCFCFGDEDSSISIRTLFRTSSLAVVALLLVVSAFGAGASTFEDWAYEVIIAGSLVGVVALGQAIPNVLEAPHGCD